MKDAPPVRTESPDVSPPKDFTEFMRQYKDMVFSTAVRLVNDEALAEDIAQETFIKAHEHFDMLAVSPSAGGWLKTVATRLGINHLQRYRSRWKFFSEIRTGSESDGEESREVEFAAPETFFAGIDAAERSALIQESLARLPEHQRVPLVLYHFEDLSYEDIARQLRISLAKVKTDILRGRAALARLLASANPSRQAGAA
jgi:RNA polymerase sigma-70 factor (ECF subfamily)